MASQDEFDVSEDDSDDMTVPESTGGTQAPVSDLAFVASLAQAELDLINSVHDDDDDDDEEEEEEEEEGDRSACSIDDATNVTSSAQEKDGESDSESSSSSEDESEDDDSDNKMMAHSDDEDDTPTASSILRTKNEIVVEEIEPVGVELTEAEELSLVGEVMSVVATENTIVIQAIHTQTPLDEGSVLCLGNRKIIGKISELFGPLSSPFYVVKCNFGSASGGGGPKKTPVPLPSTEEQEKTNEVKVEAEAKEEVGVQVQQADIDDIQPGVSVYVAVQHSSYVTPQSLSAIKNMKGSDASNMWDEEIGDDEKEFSDDEQEAAYRKSKKNLKRNNAGAVSIGGQREREGFTQPSRRQNTGGFTGDIGSVPSRSGGGGGYRIGNSRGSGSAGSRQVPYGQQNVVHSGAPYAQPFAPPANMYTPQTFPSGSSGNMSVEQQHHHLPPPLPLSGHMSEAGAGAGVWSTRSYGSVQAGTPLGSSATPHSVPLPPPAAFIPPPQPFQWPAGAQPYQQHQQRQYQQQGMMLPQGGMYSTYSPIQQQQQYNQQPLQYSNHQFHHQPPPVPPTNKDSGSNNGSHFVHPSRRNP